MFERITDAIVELILKDESFIEILGSKTPHFNARIQSRFVN